MNAPPRSTMQRLSDTHDRLGQDIDAWVSTAGADTPQLIPLSFLWDGATLLFATPADSPTGRNLTATAAARIALGHTRDVVLIDAAVETLTAAEVSPAALDAFAAKTGFDPRDDPRYRYYRARPERVRAWRESNELRGRDLMRDGEWVL